MSSPPFLTDDDPAWASLIDHARDAAAHAWAPYSRYHVGAALLGSDGVIYSGCNVENATYGATVCAERHAVAAAIRAGTHRFRALVVHVHAAEPALPCGLCRQVLSEFQAELPILSVSSSDAVIRTNLREIFPSPFDRDALERVQRAHGGDPVTR